MVDFRAGTGLKRKKASEGAATREPKDNPLFVRSLAKAFQVLEVFDTPLQYLGLTEIVAASGLDKSAAQRFLYTLQALGFLERDEATRRYALGRKVLDLSFSFLRSNPVIERATPLLIDLRRNTNERVALSLWDDLTIIYAVRLQSKRETFSSTLIGRRMPVFCTSGGRAILSRLPEEEARDIIARSDRKPLTRRTLTDPEEIFAQVMKARREGYSLNEEEALVGEITASSAVLGTNARPVGAVHVSASLSEWSTEDFERRVVPQVIEAAHALNP